MQNTRAATESGVLSGVCSHPQCASNQENGDYWRSIDRETRRYSGRSFCHGVQGTWPTTAGHADARHSVPLHHTPALPCCRLALHSPQQQLRLQPRVEAQSRIKGSAQSALGSCVCCWPRDEKLVVELKPTPAGKACQLQPAHEHNTSVALRTCTGGERHTPAQRKERQWCALCCSPRHPPGHALLLRRAPALSSPPTASPAPRLGEPSVCTVLVLERLHSLQLLHHSSHGRRLPHLAWTSGSTQQEWRVVCFMLRHGHGIVICFAL